MIADVTIEGRKSATHDDLSIRLQSQCANKGVGAAPEVDGRVGFAVGIQTGQPVSAYPVECCEVPRNDKFSVRLRGQGVDRVVTSIDGGHKERIETAVAVQSRQEIARRPIE